MRWQPRPVSPRERPERPLCICVYWCLNASGVTISRLLAVHTGQLTRVLALPAGEDIAKETAKEWKGLRVTVKLTVQNRVAKVRRWPASKRPSCHRTVPSEARGLFRQVLIRVECDADKSGISHGLLLGVKVSVIPSAGALVIKALKEPQRDRKKVGRTLASRRFATYTRKICSP
jgi:ribosomal protein L11